MYWAITDMTSGGLNSAALGFDFAAAAGGTLLIAGLWTPVAGAVVAIEQAWLALSQSPAPGAHLVMAALNVSLAMLGPGAWSVDARIFGRKVVHSGGHSRGRSRPL
jgi:uncharacterized membrane protein YphA (DoxX/SURF4 family)